MANPFEQFVSQPAAAGAETEPQAPVAESLTLGDRAVDLARAGVGMLRDTAQGIVQAPLAIGEFLSPITDKVTGGNPEVTKAAFKAVRSKLSFSEVEEQKTVVGGVARSLGKWVLLAAAMPAAPVAAGATVAARLGAGAVANFGQGFLGTAPDEKGLSNLIESNPTLQNPVTEFLATNPNDNEALKRFKGAIENVAVGGAAEALIIGFKAQRAANALKAEGKVDEAAAVMAEAAPQMEKAYAKAASEPMQMSIFPDNAGIYSDPLLTPAEITKTTKRFPSLTEEEITAASKMTGEELHSQAESAIAAHRKLLDAGGAVGDDAVIAANEKASLYHNLEQRRAYQDVVAAPTDPYAKLVDNAKAQDAARDAKYGTEMITVYRHGKTGETAFFGESEAAVAPFRESGTLHSMQIAASEAEKFRASNLLKDPTADPNLIAEAKLAGTPEKEFVFPKDKAKLATEHTGPEGLGTKATLADPNVSSEAKAALRKELGIPDVEGATTRVASKTAVLEEFTINRSRGQDGVTGPLEGVINYSKYGSAEGVKQLMSTVVKTVKNDLPDLAGSYQSQKETAELAKLLGKDTTDLYTSLAAMRMGSEDMAAHVVAGKALIMRISSDLYDVATKLSNGLGTDVDKVAFAHMTDVLASAMDHVSVIQTEAARATAAGRMRVGMQGITKENFAQLLEKVGGSDAVMALAKRISAADDAAGIVAAVKGTPGKFMAIHNFIWMNGVLGGLKTGVVNLTTTGFNSALMPGFRIVGGLADEIGAKAGLPGSVAGAGREQILKGMYQYQVMTSVWRDSLKMANKAFKQGESVLDPSSSPLGQLKGNMLAQDFTGIDNEAIGRGVEYLGKAVSLPSKFLMWEDEFFKQTMYRSHVMSSAYVDGLSQGLEGKPLQDFINTRLASSIGDMGKGLDDAAMLQAKAATFTQDLAAETLRGNRTISEGIAGFANAHPVVKGLILPFVKVPSNLVRQAWDMTPGLNLLRTQFRADLAAGGEARAMALGKMGVGTAMWGTAISLAMNGRITGAGPRDKDLRKQLGPKWKPYSFVFNTGEFTDDGQPVKDYISFARFDPFGMFFGLAADAAEVGGKLKEAEYGEAAGKMSMALVKNLSSKTYLRALTDVLDAATGDEKQFKRWAQSRIASYVPGYIQLLNTDDELKDIRGWFDGLISRVPGWSQTLEAKRDNFGEKVMPPMGHPYTAFNPFTFFRSTKDSVRYELAGLAQDDIEARFPLPSPTFGPKGKEVDLREIKNEKGQSAYDRWLELHSKMEVGGLTLHESMKELFASQNYKEARAALGKGDPLHKASLATDLVRKEFDLYEKHTWLQIEEEFPGLAEAVQEFKMGQKTTRVEGSKTATPIDQLRDLAGQR